MRLVGIMPYQPQYEVLLTGRSHLIMRFKLFVTVGMFCLEHTSTVNPINISGCRRGHGKLQEGVDNLRIGANGTHILLQLGLMRMTMS
jgi:hypothetical protein